MTTNPQGYAVGNVSGQGAPDETLTAAATRAPLSPWRLSDGRSVWLLMMDPYTAANFKGNAVVNSGIMAIAMQADLRGDNNRVFKGIIGSVGQLVLVEVDAFFDDLAEFLPPVVDAAIERQQRGGEAEIPQGPFI